MELEIEEKTHFEIEQRTLELEIKDFKLKPDT